MKSAKAIGTDTLNVLIVYGTSEGQTRKIARVVADEIARFGHTAKLLDAADLGPDFRISDGEADAVIVAASLHVHRFQSAVIHVVKANRNFLNSVPTAFLAVSLAAAGDEADLKDASDCVECFLHETEWKVGTVQHVAGAFRYTEYDFFKRWAMKLIARRHGQPTDASQDYELTDWNQLERFCQRFADSLAK